MAHADQEGRVLHRRQRTMCEDIDEILGRVGDAVRRDRVEEAARLLSHAVVIATELSDRLSPRVPGHWRPAPRVGETALDEADVQRTLVLLEELDAELDHTARGHGARREAALAVRLVSDIVDLASAAASGRCRPRTSSLPAYCRGGVMVTQNIIDGRLEIACAGWPRS